MSEPKKRMTRRRTGNRRGQLFRKLAKTVNGRMTGKSSVKPVKVGSSKSKSTAKPKAKAPVAKMTKSKTSTTKKASKK